MKTLIQGILILGSAISILYAEDDLLSTPEMRKHAKGAVEIGWTYFNKGDYKTALRRFKIATRHDKTFAPGYYGMAYVFSIQGKLDNAIKYYLKTLTYDKIYPYTFANLGYALLQKQRFDEAVKMLDKALQLDPKCGESYLSYANYYAYRKDWKKAEESANKAVECGQKIDPEFRHLLEKNGIKLKAGKGRAGTIDSDEVGATKTRTRKKGFPYGAWKQENTCSKNAMVYIGRGYNWYIQCEYEKAIADYNEAIQINPKMTSAYRYRGDAWHMIGNQDKAIADYDKAIRIDPTMATAYDSRGIAWKAKGKHDKAIADFSKAIQLDPTNAYGTYNNRAMLWWEMGKCDKAIADLNKAIQLAPDRATAYHHKSMVLEAKGKNEKSLENSDKAIRMEPDDGLLYHQRGLIWEMKENYAKAIADYRKAIQFTPKDEYAHCSLAALLASCPEEKYRDGKKAIASAEQACELTGWKYLNAIEILAAAYAEVGDFDKAIKWQMKVINLAHDRKEILRLRSRLELYKARKPYHQRPKTKRTLNGKIGVESLRNLGLELEQ